MIYDIILTILLIATIACSAWFIRKYDKAIGALQAKIEQIESKVGQIESEIPGEVNELFTMLGKIDQFLVSQFLMPMAANQLSDKEWPAEIVIEDNVYPVSEYLVGATLKFDDKNYEITEVYNKNVRLKKI